MQDTLYIPHVYTPCHGVICMQVDGGTQSEVAAMYNTSSNTFTPYHVPQLAEAAGHILLPDGRGLIIGGTLLVLGLLF